MIDLTFYSSYYNKKKAGKIMARKFYGEQTFRATVNGTEYVFTCAGQDTSYGFRHVCFEGNHVSHYNKPIAKACYYNRTWESFRYETVLRQAIDKQPKADQEGLTNILIKKIQQEEHEKCERDIAVFKALYEKTSDNFKDNIAPKLFINSEADMNAVKGIMALDAIFNGNS